MIELFGPEFSSNLKDKPKKLVLLLHGLGSNGEDLISLASSFQDVLPDALFLSPNAPFPCDFAPEAFQWFSYKDTDELVLYNGIKKAIAILSQYINKRLSEYSLSYQDLILIGFSQGAMLSMHLSMQLPQACMCVISFSGKLFYNQIKDTEIISKSPILLLHGEYDVIIPCYETEISADYLKSKSFEVKSHIFPYLQHSINDEELEVAKSFIRLYVC